MKAIKWIAIVIGVLVLWGLSTDLVTDFWFNQQPNDLDDAVVLVGFTQFVVGFIAAMLTLKVGRKKVA